MIKQTLRLAAATWLASAACDGNHLPASSGAIPRDQLLGQFAALICDHLAPCCQANGVGYDGASCRQTAEAAFAAGYGFASSSYTAYDGLAARGCLDAFAAALPACGARDAFWGELPLDENEYQFPASVVAACKDVLKGTAPVGTPCTSSKECATPAQGIGYCDLGNSDTCVAYDAPFPHAAAGARCDGECEATPAGTPCYGLANSSVVGECYLSDGLDCAVSGTNGEPVCVRLGAIGQPCADGCVMGAACDDAGVLCVAISELGGPCETDGQCANGTFCDAGVCASPRDSGPCQDAAQAPDPRACSVAAYCDLETTTCMPKKPDGASCTQVDSCINDCGTPNGPIAVPSFCVKTGLPPAALCMGHLLG